jgi:AraC family transcriptional regulator
MDNISNPRPNEALVLASSGGRGWRKLEAELVRVSPGRTHVPGAQQHRLGIHFGRPVNAECRCDGRVQRRVQKHGDIDIVPAGFDGVWQDDRECTILRMKVAPALIENAAIDLGMAPDRSHVVPTLQLRDPRLEAIAWAVKTELEADTPSDRLYADTLAVALAIRMLEAGATRQATVKAGQMLALSQKTRLVEFIEYHLDTALSLEDLANAAGLSLTHLKLRFRNSFGVSPHQYVLRRRVERARELLATSDQPASQIAIETGFAHQSHMTHAMRRLLGVTPRDIPRIRR